MLIVLVLFTIILGIYPSIVLDVTIIIHIIII